MEEANVTLHLTRLHLHDALVAVCLAIRGTHRCIDGRTHDVTRATGGLS